MYIFRVLCSTVWNKLLLSRDSTSSVITRIFFNSVQCLDGYISACFNKDTRNLFMLCIMLVCQLYRVVFYYCCSIYLIIVQLLFEFCSSFVRLLFSFDYFAFSLSLLVVQRKKFNSDPGLYSRYFDPVVR
jgi:hypothetical protein